MSPSSIKVAIPLWLGFLACLLVAVSAGLNWRTEVAKGEALMQRRAVVIGNFVAPRVERALAANQPADIMRELANAALTPHLDVSLVADETNHVRYCLAPGWQDRPLAATGAAGAAELLARARATMSTQVGRSPDGAVLRAAFPIALPPQPGELRSSRAAVYYLEFDLVEPRRELGAELLERAAVQAAIAVLLCVAVSTYLHHRFTRRVGALVTAAGALSRGERPVLPEQPASDELGEITSAFQAMSHQLRQQLDRLQLSEQRHRSAMHESVVGVGIMDLEGRFLEVNPALCAIVGRDSAELVGTPAQLLNHPDDRKGGPAIQLAALGGTRDEYEREKRYLHRDGRIVWVQAHVKLVRDAEGRPQHFISQVIDVSARRQAEFERERLARAIDAHYDGAYWLDTAHRIVYVNDAACRAVGYTREELVGRHISLLAPQVTAERMGSVWWELRTKGMFAAQGRHRRKDGSEFPVEVVSAYVRIGGEEYNCGFARDLTEREADRREMERRLAELQRWQRVTVDREGRVRELKAEVNALALRLGEPVPYPSQLDAATVPARGGAPAP